MNLTKRSDYISLSDEELVELSRGGDEVALGVAIPTAKALMLTTLKSIIIDKIKLNNFFIKPAPKKYSPLY